jgi:hypothetical protein
MEEIGEKAGSIKRIKLENFMCHGSLIIELLWGLHKISLQGIMGVARVPSSLLSVLHLESKHRAHSKLPP